MRRYNKHMAFSSARGTALCLLATAVLFAQDWKTAQELPSVDFTGLTAAQKALALKVLRTGSCPCACGLKIAECRTVDTPCQYSKSLAALVVTQVKKGANESAVLDALEASPLMHRAHNTVLEPAVAIPVSAAPVLGPKDARVTLVEFSDFQCPYCAVAVLKLNAILKAYPNDVRLIYKQFPLEMHSQAALAAAAALAAQRQGKFWQLHDLMYLNRTHLSRQTILELAGTVGLDVKRFQQDWDSPAIKQAVARDQADGDKIGVDATPTIYIDGQRYNGDLDLDAIRPYLEKEIKRR